MNQITVFKTRTFPSLQQLKEDFSWPAIMAGLVAVIVGYAGPTVLVFKVAESAHLSNEQITSWLWAYSIAAGITTIIGSLIYRMPLITAWSTPGIAFLMTAMAGVSFSDAIGAFILSNVLIVLVGSFGLLQRLVQWIPLSIASALNGGILVTFALGLISSLQGSPALVGGMVLTYFIVRRFSPRWSVAAVLFVGAILCLLFGKLDVNALSISTATPMLTMPTFSWNATINIAIPLAVLALTGQYLPGFAVLKTSGYEPPVNKVVSLCGFGSILVAPFGCHNINPSSMIAAIVAGPEAHADKSKRYVAAVFAGIIYIIFGTFATTFVNLFSSLPKEAVAALAGLALLTAISSSFDSAFVNSKGSLAPLVVFVVAASGFTIFGIGAAFWAIVSGIFIFHVMEKKSV